MTGSPYSYGYGDPGSPYSYDYRDPGPHIHKNMGTRGPQSRGSPFSHDTGIPRTRTPVLETSCAARYIIAIMNINFIIINHESQVIFSHDQCISAIDISFVGAHIYRSSEMNSSISSLFSMPIIFFFTFSHSLILCFVASYIASSYFTSILQQNITFQTLSPL